MNETERRRLDLERELYNILYELWMNKTNGIGVCWAVYIDAGMAQRIKDALGVAH